MIKKKLSLYLMSILYTIAGMLHFIVPGFYLKLMPVWMPVPTLLILLSGVVELALAGMLLVEKTRTTAAYLITAMLVVFFFLIHLPQTILFYQTQNPYLLLSILRLPVQVLLVGWAFSFQKTDKPALPDNVGNQ